MLTLTLATGLGLLVGTGADAAITLGLSSVENATIQFTGTGSQSTVTFANGPSGNTFAITTVDDSPGGSPSGLFGTISGAFTYMVAGITTVGPLQTAALSGSGVLSVGPAGGPALTADIGGIDILSIGAIGGVNGLTSAINLSNISYSGSNVALLQLADEASADGGIVTFSYQFGSAKSLSNLAAVGLTTTTYSGTITTAAVPVPVPEPGTVGMALSGVAILGLGCYRRRWQRLA
jgi:hypothetical protein